METIPEVSLPQGVVILDGGMGQELLRRGMDGTNTLWSAHALITAPETVRAVHEDYIEAGANIITTNTYATTRRRLARAGIENRFASLNKLAGKLACQAREASGHDVLIAGSLPPLRGSYRPDLVGSFDQMEPLYREQAELLAPYVGILICETMSSGEEAHAAVMPELAALGTGPVGGYANGFVRIPDKWVYTNSASLPDAREDLDPATYADYVDGWVEAGARIVGGCCEVGPAHIARLHEHIRVT